MKVLLFATVLFLQSIVATAQECRAWFKGLNIQNRSDCLLKCSMGEVDMGTFHCPQLCGNLCKTPKTKKIIFKLSRLYPALTKSERALVAQHPIQMLKAYQLSWKAEQLCSALFISIPNRENDACRHFVWAALLYQKFGLDLSQKVLNAHEQLPNQPPREKAMDLNNNQLGLTTAKNLLNKNQFNKKNLLKSFKKQLKSGNIIILKQKSVKKE